MKALDATLETEVAIKNGTITISQTPTYSKQSIEIPVALWGVFVSKVSSEIMGGDTLNSTEKIVGDKDAL